MSNAIAMSEPRLRWIRAAISGEKRAGGAVVDGAEGDAVVADVEQRVAKREDLEAAGVGQDRPVPARERVQAAQLRDQLVARAEMEVIGVAEDDLCADGARASSGSRLFTVAFVPTGMNAGVLTSPWAVRRIPARAAPSVAVTSKQDTAVQLRDTIAVRVRGRIRSADRASPTS